MHSRYEGGPDSLKFRNVPLSATLVVACGLIFAGGQNAGALTLANVDGIWSSAGGTGGTPTCLVYFNTSSTTDENEVRYGDNNTSSGCPADPEVQSGFGFDGSEFETFNPGDVFFLGVFTHYNRPIYADNNFTHVNLAVTLSFSDPVLTTTLNYTMTLDETPNSGHCTCPELGVSSSVIV